MTDPRGYYEKFEVRRKDGRDQPGGDREGARYFTLDFIHDPHARIALAAYAESIRPTNRLLAMQLYAQLDQLGGS